MSDVLHVFRFADGRVEKHPAEVGREFWQLRDRDGDGPDGPRFIRRTFRRREFRDANTGAIWAEYHEETA